MRKILILGLGKFGRRVCSTLALRKGIRVYAFDCEQKLVERLADSVHTAGSGDLNDPDALKAFLTQVGEVDAAIISLGDAVNTSILAALQLREQGVSRIIVKAVDENHRRVLEAIDHGFPGERRFEVVIPELDAAERTARTVASDFVAGEIPLGPELTLMEVACPDDFTTESLKDLELRRRFHVTVVGYRTREPEGTPESQELRFAAPDTVLPKGSLITLVGRRKDLEALEKRFG